MESMLQKPSEPGVLEGASRTDSLLAAAAVPSASAADEAAVQDDRAADAPDAEPVPHSQARKLALSLPCSEVITTLL